MPRTGLVRSAESADISDAIRSGTRVPVTGVYNIGAVASMLHVPPATLRTWEERYGIISPDRTPGGHRLYSRIQIEQL